MILSQEFEDDEHPILHLSRKLLPLEQKSAIIEKECLGIKWAVEVFCYYFLEAWFCLVADHDSLTCLNAMQEASPQLTR